MISRLILAVQYGIVLWFARRYKRTIIPLGFLVLLYVATGFAFFGVSSLALHMSGQSDAELNSCAVTI